VVVATLHLRDAQDTACKETIVQKRNIALMIAFGLTIGACAKKEVAVAPPPPLPGAVAGSVAADRDGDGIVDGYYSSDGIYNPNVVPAPPPAPVRVSRKGERG
jgi:hypothetical protein